MRSSRTFRAGGSVAERWARTSCARLLERVAGLIEKSRAGKVGAAHVHQLRSACRRAEVSLELLAPLLPGDQRTRATRLCTKLRKRSGRVRDCDVAIGLARRMRRRAGEVERPVWTALIRRLRRRRDRSATALAEHCTKSVLRKLSRLERALGRGKRAPARAGKATLAAWSGAVGTAARAASRMLGEGLASDEAMHHARLEFKRVRVALKLCPDRRGDLAEEAIGAATDRMGFAHDMVVLVEELSELAGGPRGGKRARALAAALEHAERTRARAASRAQSLMRRDGKRLLDAALAASSA